MIRSALVLRGVDLGAAEIVRKHLTGSLSAEYNRINLTEEAFT